MTELTDRLSERKIVSIFCIDDENAPPAVESIDEAVEAIATQSPRRLRNFAKIDSRFEALSELRTGQNDIEVDERRAQLRPVVEELVEKHHLLGQDFRRLGETLYQGYKGDTADRLTVPFPGRLLQSLSFAQWREQVAGIVQGVSADARILLLVDERNDRETTVDLDGVKVLASLWRDHRAALAHIDVIVLTSNCAPDKEFEEARSLLQAVREELRAAPPLANEVTRAFVISKDRLDQDPLDSHFVVHLNRLRAAQLRGELVALTTQALREAVTESIGWFEQIPLSEFQGSVFVSSGNEGAAEIDTLLRLAGIRQRVGLEQKLRSDGTLRDKLAELRSFSLKQLDAEHVAASQSDLRELRHLEFERPANHVNSLMAPLACGDVFFFKSGAFERTAMLIGNPCDLALRSDGTRKLRRAWLVEVSRDTKAVLQKLEQDRGARAPLSYMLLTGNRDQDTAYLFNNSNIESIDLTVLDLCWTNTHGNAELYPPSALDAFGFVLPPQRKRLQTLAEKARISKFGSIELWGADLPPTVEDSDEQVLGEVRLDKRVSYSISRCWRLAPEFAAAVLSVLAQSMARPVFGHDYLRLE